MGESSVPHLDFLCQPISIGLGAVALKLLSARSAVCLPAALLLMGQAVVQALRQPPGVLSQRQHFMSVLPLFVEPIAAYALYVLWNTSQSLLERRDNTKLATAEAKLRKMIAELKVWTCKSPQERLGSPAN